MKAIRTTSLSLVLLAASLTPSFASPYPQANEYYKVRDRANALSQLVPEFKQEDVSVMPQQYAGKLLEVKGVVRAAAGSDDRTTLLISPGTEGGATGATGATYTVLLPVGRKLSDLPFLDVGFAVRVLCKVVTDDANTGALEVVMPVKEHEAAAVDGERAKKAQAEAIRKAAEDRARTQVRQMASRGVGRTAYRPGGSTGVPHYAYILGEYTKAVRYFNRRLAEGDARQIAAIIIEHSRQYDLDARLVMAVIAVESNFNANAVSPVGAQGLGQLMPGTANDLGVRDAFDIRSNLEGSTRLLKQHTTNMSRGGRSDEEAVKLALACYNAGAGAVKKYKGIPPYRETQNYVRKIMRLYRQMCGRSVDQS